MGLSLYLSLSLSLYPFQGREFERRGATMVFARPKVLSAELRAKLKRRGFGLADIYAEMFDLGSKQRAFLAGLVTGALERILAEEACRLHEWRPVEGHEHCVICG